MKCTFNVFKLVMLHYQTMINVANVINNRLIVVTDNASELLILPKCVKQLKQSYMINYVNFN